MERYLFYKQPAKNWNEALPLGNGQLGAMVHGGTEEALFSLNHDTLWSGYVKTEPLKDVSEYTKKAQTLLSNGQFKEAQTLLEEHVCGPFHEGYLPMGDLKMQFSLKGKVSNYDRRLDLKEGRTVTSYTQNNCDVQQEAFVSFPHNVFAVHTVFSKKTDICISLETQLKGQKACEQNVLYIKGECPTRVEPNYVKHDNPIVYDSVHDSIRFAFGIKVQTDGNVQYTQEHIHVTNATFLLVVLKAQTSFIDYKTSPKDEQYACKTRLIEGLTKENTTYEMLLKAHTEDFTALESRCTLSLTEENSIIPTDERLMHFDGTDVGLHELLLTFARYLTISSSRVGSQAINLQGIWNKEMRPPWSSNYTLNINTEMNYWPTFKGNLVELALPLISLIKDLSEKGQEVAQKVHGAKGYCAHHNTDLWRNCTPVGNHEQGCACYGYWPMGAIWLLLTAYDYYDYTRDEAFLKMQLYPLFQGAVDFVLSTLVEDEDGHLVLSPATSSENNFALDKAHMKDVLSVDVSTAMMQEMAFDLLTKYAEICLVLFKKPNEQVLSAVQRLRPITLTSDQRINEWHNEHLETEVHHRHLSHLFALYPAHMMDNNEALQKAAINSLKVRGDEGTGWSLAWKVCMYARLHDGEKALELLNMQLRYIKSNGKLHMSGGGTYINMFCAHPPFQIDGNLGVGAGILEMLIAKNGADITLLPALPALWKKGSLKGVLLQGGIVVDMEWENNAVTKIAFTCPYDTSISVKAKERIAFITLKANQTVQMVL